MVVRDVFVDVSCINLAGVMYIVNSIIYFACCAPGFVQFVERPFFVNYFYAFSKRKTSMDAKKFIGDRKAICDELAALLAPLLQRQPVVPTTYLFLDRYA